MQQFTVDCSMSPQQQFHYKSICTNASAHKINFFVTCFISILTFIYIVLHGFICHFPCCIFLPFICSPPAILFVSSFFFRASRPSTFSIVSWTKYLFINILYPTSFTAAVGAFEHVLFNFYCFQICSMFVLSNVLKVGFPLSFYLFLRANIFVC